jgi:fructokinase
MSQPKVLSCGEVLWDLFPEGARFGGASANFACHAALQGAHVTLLSAVGQDARGDEALSILESFGIDTTLVQRLSGVETGSVFVTLDAVGKPSFEIHANAAWDMIAWTDAVAARIAEVDVVYFGSLSQRGEISKATILRGLEVAKARGIARVLDINLRKPFYDKLLIAESIAHASILKLSDDELPEVAAACGIALKENPEDTLRGLLVKFELEIVVMTRGAEGALLVSSTQVISQPGIPTIVKDTVGAGDSFTAAFIIGFLRKEGLDHVLQKACETASAVCAQSGAVPISVSPAEHC